MHTHASSWLVCIQCTTTHHSYLQCTVPYCTNSCLVCILAELQRHTGWTLECRSCSYHCLPKVEVILPFFIWGPWPFRIFAWIGATNFGVPPPVSLHHDFWQHCERLTGKPHGNQENCSEIKHDWTCRFQLLERDDQYDWKLWLHWCLGWKLLHDCTMCYNQPATSKPQCIWTCTDPFIIHQFGLPACFLPDWFAARNDQTWKLFEVFHCKLRFSEHYGEFVLGGRSLLVFAGNRCEWMASAQNDCSAYSCSRFLSTWTPGFKSCSCDRKHPIWKWI